MNHKNLIERYRLPKGTISAIAGVHPPELSLYLRDKTLLSAVKVSRIETAITNLVEAIEAYREQQARIEATGAPVFLFEPNLRDIRTLRRIIKHCESVRSGSAKAAQQIVAALQ